MKKMLLAMLISSFFFASVAFAAPINPAVRTVFNDGMAAGTPVKEIVALAMKIGPNLDSVLAMAKELEGKIDPKEVFAALTAQGVSPANLANSALNAGFPADQVASIMTATSTNGTIYTAADVTVLAESVASGSAPSGSSSGLAYTPAETPPPAAPTPPGSVGGTGRGTSVSPSQP